MFDFHEPEIARFPKANCTTCGRDVIVYRDVDDNGHFSHHCVDCDTLTTAPANEGWSVVEAEAAGYQLESTVPEGSGCGDGHCSH